MGYVDLSEANAVPAGAMLYLKALLYDPSRELPRQGIPEDEFIRKWNDFSVIVNIDGKERCTRVGPGVAAKSLMEKLKKSEPIPTVTKAQ